MKRRIYSLLAVVCLILAVTPAVRAVAFIYTITGGDIYFDPTTGAVTGGDTSIREIDIPDELGGAKVTSIGYQAFKNYYLTKVSLPDSLTSIDGYAFYQCLNLESINIPNNVISIGDYAFRQCFSLSSISIPNSVTSIGRYAFSGCTGLTSVSIPDSMASINSRAFDNCVNLTSVSIPNSITSIGSSAFSNCTGLADVYYDGTQEEYETKLRPNVDSGNDAFLNATFHFNEGTSPTPPSSTPTTNPGSTLPNTAASDHTALYGTIFILLAALTLTVWAMGRRKKYTK